jgi:D-tyrosyl-tRNA(Tyr) deacylase
MRALLQRVTRARVVVHGAVVGEIGTGLCALVGIAHDDDESTVARMAEKIVGLRIMADEAGRMNASVHDVGGEVLVVSQFTLYGDARKGRRPSFVQAAPPDRAEPLVELLTERLRALGVRVATGRFGADMAVELVNDGPVTIMLEM